MRKSLYMVSAAVALLFFGCKEKKSAAPALMPLTQYVNPFMGTEGPGNTYPGAQVPFGMVQLSPDNEAGGWYRISGYDYPDSVINSFSMTHLSGTGAGDLYDFAFMPAMTKAGDKNSPFDRTIGSRFSHDRESASPGYYSVYLEDSRTLAELTATERCGVQRYTFEKGSKLTPSVYIDLARAINWDATTDSRLTLDDSVTVSGYRFSEGWATNQRLYFVAKFSHPISVADIQHKEIKGGDDGKRRRGYAARLDFGSEALAKPLVVKVAISPVSVDNARENLAKEVGSWDFDSVRTAADSVWNVELNKIIVETQDDNAKRTFYTTLYQSSLAPVIFMDVNGEYRGPDNKTHKTDGWVNYSRYSLWDTYRAAHPLYTLTQQKRVGDMIQSMIAFAEQNGRLPVWNMQGVETDMMIGYHSVPVIADAYLKGIGGFDPRKALEACVKSADIDDYRGIGLYKKYGYIPYELEGESVSKTLEYAFDDYAIAKMARALGENETADRFEKRADFWRNVYDSESSFMRPKDKNGKWIKGFVAKDYTTHFTESNAWQYFWSVQHDVPALIEAVGGNKRFNEKLDSMFTFVPLATDELPIFSTGMIGQYVHGNEPSHHVAYLYNYSGEAWKTQSYVRQIMTTQYRATPSGHCGNEDCGQMSAWFVLSSLGFYPVNPVGGDYDIGSPLFDKATINLSDGKKFVITAKNNSPRNIYVESVTLNGKPLDGYILKHSDIMKGGELVFVMSDKPTKK